MRTSRRAPIQNPKPRIRNGFTLVEMLTVIGIIVLLVSILLPVVSAVRTKGHVADTQAMLARIATGIESYYADFKAYPGPLHNGQIYAGGGTPPAPAITIVNPPAVGGAPPAFVPEKVTQSENLVLGLLGGLKATGTPPNLTWTFDWNALGSGPNSLNTLAPKKHRAYMDKVNLSQGDYKDEAGDADDSALPEFVDRFPAPMPILYMRANVGRTGIVSNEVPIATQQQYDLKQIKAYTLSEPGKTIGEGREAPSPEDFSPPKSPGAPREELLKHGLRAVTPGSTIVKSTPPVPGQTYLYPYDLYGFMRHPSMANTPRQKDSYILISAGADRIYGTRDDAVYPAVR